MNRLSQLRQEKGLNMREAARGLNMPYTTYVNYEKGTREPNSETLIALAEFYGVSIDYLLCKSSTPNSGEIPPGFQPMPRHDRGATGWPDRLRHADHGRGERGAHGLCPLKMARHLHADLRGHQHGAAYP